MRKKKVIQYINIHKVPVDLTLTAIKTYNLEIDSNKDQQLRVCSRVSAPMYVFLNPCIVYKCYKYRKIL